MRIFLLRLFFPELCSVEPVIMNMFTFTYQLGPVDLGPGGPQEPRFMLLPIDVFPGRVRSDGPPSTSFIPMEARFLPLVALRPEPICDCNSRALAEGKRATLHREFQYSAWRCHLRVLDRSLGGGYVLGEASWTGRRASGNKASNKC